MIRYFTLLFLLVLLLQGRENPFFPVDNNTEVPLTSNHISQVESLDTLSIRLPSTARVVESVTIKYKNLDGSVSEKTQYVRKAIDWHNPLVVTQSRSEAVGEKSTHKRVKHSKKQRYKKLFYLKFIRLYQAKRSLKIVTSDRLLRDFVLVKPHRIVCDFKRDINIRSYTKSFPKGRYFKAIKIGSHNGYYRAVIELDGFYSYTIQRKNGYYLLRLH